MQIDQFQNIAISKNELIIKRSEMIRLLGYKENNPDNYILEQIETYSNATIELATPRTGYILLPIDKLKAKQGVLEVGGISFQIGKIIASQLKDALYLVVFVATLGEKPEEQSKKLFDDGENLDGYILNLAASEAAEGIADLLHEHIINSFKRYKLKATNRFSPGYCTWNVAEQKLLFQLLPESNIGIHLNDSALMTPIKSVSGIIGIGKNVRYRDYSCKLCKDINCLYRKSQ